jgi:hypothetical protein
MNEQPSQALNNSMSLVNIVYDDELVILINKLSASIKDYYKLAKKNTDDLSLISKTISENTFYAKSIATDMQINNSIKQISNLITKLEN